MGKKKCPYCGEEIMETAKKCRFCGEWLEQSAESSHAQDKPVAAQPAEPVPPVPPMPEYDEEPKAEEASSWLDAYFVQPFFRQYADFSGVTNVKSFWLSMLAYYVLSFGVAGLALLLLSFGMGGIIAGCVVAGIVSLGLMIPMLALQCRRLRDAGKSPWMILLTLIPIIGQIIVLVFWCQESIYEHEKLNVKFKGVDWGVLGGSIALFIVGVIMFVMSFANGFLSGFMGDSYDLSDWENDNEVIEAVYDDDEDTMIGEAVEVEIADDDYPDMPNDKVIVTAPGAFAGDFHEYTGKIDNKYRINMTLDFDARKGSYYYLTSNASGSLDLYISSYDADTHKITIYEENSKGENTGLFEGVVRKDGGAMTGVYTNYQGKQMTFDIKINDEP